MTFQPVEKWTSVAGRRNMRSKNCASSPALGTRALSPRVSGAFIRESHGKSIDLDPGQACRV